VIYGKDKLLVLKGPHREIWQQLVKTSLAAKAIRGGKGRHLVLAVLKEAI